MNQSELKSTIIDKIDTKLENIIDSTFLDKLRD